MSRERDGQWSRAFAATVIFIALLALSGTQAARAHDEPNGRPHHKGIPANPTAVMRAFMNDSQAAQSQLAVESDIPCSGGFAGDYPCSGVDLLAFMPLLEIGGDHNGSAANDIWGWTDSVTSREFALVGRVFGTSFVEITDPVNPVYLAELFTHNGVGSSWRDIKVFDDHAFIVSEASGHGMQVVELTQLLSLAPADAPYALSETAHYAGFGRAHNLVINEATGFAYAVGVSEAAPGTCSAGLHMIDISSPTAPVFAGCFSADGYTHDAQCVAYSGPDIDYPNAEICFAANEDTLTIVDVTDKANPLQVSRTGYSGRGYTHQAWLNEEHTLLFLDDELDEQNFRHGTKTRVWDVTDLDAPSLIDEFVNVTDAIDHNLYVKGDLIYQANYRAGLTVLEVKRDGSGDYVQLSERAFFDIYPSSDSPSFNGAWSNYPYFPSGNVVVSGIEQGLFVLGLDLPDEVAFVSPREGATVSGSNVAIDIFARDGELGAAAPTVMWRVDNGSPQGTAPGAEDNHFIASWDSTAETDGLHSLTAEMTDTAFNVTVATIWVDVRNADDPPTVAFVAPQNGDPVSGNVTLQASASDDGTVMSLAFYDGGNKIGEAGLSGGLWSLRWNTKKVSEGPHTIRAEAMDDGGQTGEASIEVTVGGGGSGGGSGPGGGPKCNPKKDPTCVR
jgi:choice-of-anchor B domain-containing protein